MCEVGGRGRSWVGRGPGQVCEGRGVLRGHRWQVLCDRCLWAESSRGILLLGGGTEMQRFRPALAVVGLRGPSLSPPS